MHSALMSLVMLTEALNVTHAPQVMRRLLLPLSEFMHLLCELREELVVIL